MVSLFRPAEQRTSMHTLALSCDALSICCCRHVACTCRSFSSSFACVAAPVRKVWHFAGALRHAGDAVLHQPLALALQPGPAQTAIRLVRRLPLPFAHLLHRPSSGPRPVLCTSLKLGSHRCMSPKMVVILSQLWHAPRSWL